MEKSKNKTDQNVKDSDLIWYLEEVSNSTSPIPNTTNNINTTTACEPADEVQLGEVSYIKKETYLRLKRRIALLESYLNNVTEEIKFVKSILEEVKYG